MTGKQIEAAEKTLLSLYRTSRKWTPEEKRLERELSCRETINFCLIYKGINAFWRQRHDGTAYADWYVKDLGLERVQELAKEQEEDFAKAVVCHNLYLDSEGVTYNSIWWADDIIDGSHLRASSLPSAPS